MSREKEQVHYHNYDIVQKALFEKIANGTKPLLQLGIDTAEVAFLENTELIGVRTKQDQADILYRLVDNTLLHIEFQSTNKKSDIKRFCEYDAFLYNTRKGIEKIKTVVIYTKNVDPTKVITTFDAGSLKYEITPVFFQGLEGDTFFEEFKEKITTIPEYVPTAEEIMLIIYNPLMDNVEGINDRVTSITELMVEYFNEDVKFNVLGSIWAFYKKMLSEDVSDYVWEVIVMGKVFEKYNKEVVGKAIEQGINKTLKAINFIKEGYSDQEIIRELELTPDKLEEIKQSIRND